jgi:glyoxylase-like metal-dependent hydrolase (beta-lactamase superfamily II)
MSPPSLPSQPPDLLAVLREALPGASGAPGTDPQAPQAMPESPWLLRLPLRSPTLPPATHTNAYLVGEEDLLVVDPGTPDEGELGRLLTLVAALRARGRRLVGIFLTHHHVDHASGARFLQAALGVPILAHAITAERVAAQLGIKVNQPVAADELLPFGPAGLRALHTPGHAPGHLCLHDEHSGELIAGDMVASVGTILVHPDDGGDMQLYLASLRRLLATRPRRLWPAHGAAVQDPAGLLQFYIAHRLQREQKVLAALRQSAGTVHELVRLVYADTSPEVHWLAAGSLLAHLRKLQAEARATLDEKGQWRLPEGAPDPSGAGD